ncbi:YkvA family protein [Ekhidna sp.]
MDKTKKIWKKAKETAANKEQMKSTLAKAGDKLQKLAQNSNELQELKAKLQVLIRMVQSHISKEYKAFPISSIVLILFALAYFITPIDLIPDFIPALGFTDDASVVFLIVKKLNRDIKKFIEWEKEQFEEAE